MLKISYWKILGYGLLLVVIWFVVLFLMSLIFKFETEMPLSAAITFAVIMALITYFLAKMQKSTNLKSALTYSISWTIIVYLVVLFITLANDTTTVVFGSWISYLGILLMAFAPSLDWIKK